MAHHGVEKKIVPIKQLSECNEVISTDIVFIKLISGVILQVSSKLFECSKKVLKLKKTIWKL